MVGQKSVSSHS